MKRLTRLNISTYIIKYKLRGFSSTNNVVVLSDSSPNALSIFWEYIKHTYSGYRSRDYEVGFLSINDLDVKDVLSK